MSSTQSSDAFTNAKQALLLANISGKRQGISVSNHNNELETLNGSHLL
jgi:hypothetical protein